MFEYIPKLDKKITKVFSPALSFFYEKLGLSPNNLSLISGFFGLVAVFFVLIGKGFLGFVFIMVSQVFDLLDGQVAKKYKLVSRKGKILDLTIDRVIEFLLIISFVFLKKVNIYLFLIVVLSRTLSTIMKLRSNFDIGFKKIGIFAGYIIGFNLAFLILIILNVFDSVISSFIIFFAKKKTNKS
jgi:phosphatidylglycerophosphate synthase